MEFWGFFHAAVIKYIFCTEANCKLKSDVSPPSCHMVPETDTWEAEPAWIPFCTQGVPGRDEGGKVELGAVLCPAQSTHPAPASWQLHTGQMLQWDTVPAPSAGSSFGESTDGKEADEGSSLWVIQEYREARNLASFFLVVPTVPKPGNSCFLKTMQARLPTRCQELLVPAHRCSCFRACL